MYFCKPPDRFFGFNDTVIQEQRDFYAWQIICDAIICLTVFWVIGCFFYTNRWKRLFCRQQKFKGTKTFLFEAIDAHERSFHACTATRPTNFEENWGSDAIPIVIDSACSKTMTPCFEDLIDPVPYDSTVAGVGKGTITHKGTVRWTVKDENGKDVVIEDTEAYYTTSLPF